MPFGSEWKWNVKQFFYNYFGSSSTSQYYVTCYICKLTCKPRKGLKPCLYHENRKPSRKRRLLQKKTVRASPRIENQHVVEFKVISASSRSAPKGPSCKTGRDTVGRRVETPWTRRSSTKGTRTIAERRTKRRRVQEAKDLAAQAELEARLIEVDR